MTDDPARERSWPDDPPARPEAADDRGGLLDRLTRALGGSAVTIGASGAMTGASGGDANSALEHRLLVDQADTDRGP